LSKESKYGWVERMSVTIGQGDATADVQAQSKIGRLIGPDGVPIRKDLLPPAYDEAKEQRHEDDDGGHLAPLRRADQLH
jgi:hypothetical protein